MRRLVSLEIQDTSISRQPDAVDPRQRNAPGRQVAQRSSSRLPAKRPGYDAEPQALTDQPLTVSTDTGIHAPPEYLRNTTDSMVHQIVTPPTR